MMRNYNFLLVIVAFFTIVATLSCDKPPKEFPDTSEAIFFKNIENTTVEKKAGEDLIVDLVLTTDTIIDSLKFSYLIDTIGITENLTFADMKTSAGATSFNTNNNKHEYQATIKMPANAYGIRPFRPFIKGEGDYVRIIFQMKAGSKTFEKQLKVIIEP